MDKHRKIIDRTLVKYLPRPKRQSQRLIEAMRYSVLAGGKRIRPILMLAIADMLKMAYNRILPAACAVEYIHTSTLILDDLPCMDNSDLRRGKTSVHKKFGESTAILASYSLMALAFELLAKDAKAIKYISDAIGSRGVCAGQYVDLASGAKRIDMATLRYLHQHKTADLFAATCQIAGYLSGADSVQTKALKNYGRYVGLAFQAYDDILSVKKTDRQLGKETKKDKNSPNILNLFGLRSAQHILTRFVGQASAQLDVFGKKADTLRRFLTYTAQREK